MILNIKLLSILLFLPKFLALWQCPVASLQSYRLINLFKDSIFAIKQPSSRQVPCIYIALNTSISALYGQARLIPYFSEFVNNIPTLNHYSRTRIISKSLKKETRLKRSEIEFSVTSSHCQGVNMSEVLQFILSR